MLIISARFHTQSRRSGIKSRRWCHLLTVFAQPNSRSRLQQALLGGVTFSSPRIEPGGACLFVSRKSSVTYRFGHLLFQISEHFWTRFAFAALAASGVAILHVAVHETLTLPITFRRIADAGDVVAVSAFVFVLTYVELASLRERRVKVVQEVKTIAELNHNIRNALQAIQYAKYASSDQEQVEIVTSAVERIDNILKELFPVLGESPKQR
jgi:hypothetical protein